MRNYEAAIQALNSLQTNAAILEVVRKSGNLLNQMSIPEMKRYFERIGYNYQDFNRLNVIHIAGTKGKGSTSAFCSAILHEFKKNELPLKTGLYTSPHLLEVRERIRINGVPISKDLFAKYFFDVWDRLEATKPATVTLETPDKPSYFRYLTLVAFHTFMQENVDAVILEVGVGGEYDATNVIESPVVCGITSLGMDHVAVLGDTIEKIAWHKAGIIKKNTPVLSVPQPGDSNMVIQDRASERNASSVKILTDAQIERMGKLKLGLAGEHQKVNAALAYELCAAWASIQKEKGIQLVANEENMLLGLEKASWPGRCQTLKVPKYPNLNWYLDGAHTAESLLVILSNKVCAEWFKLIASQDSSLTNSLIFNCTHGRQGTALLPPLLNTFAKAGIKFENIIFTTNEPWKNNSAHSGGDLINNMVEHDTTLPTQNELANHFKVIAKDTGFLYENVRVVPNAESAVELASSSQRVLITGSLHLVGSCLTVFEVPVA